MFSVDTQKTIPAGDFKTHCLALMEEVKNKKHSLIITKYGVPVAKIIPVDEAPVNLFGWMKDSLIEQENILSPIDLPWECMK